MSKRMGLLFCVLLAGVVQAELRWMPFQEGPATGTVSSMQLAINKNNRMLLTWFQPNDQTLHAAQYHFIENNWISSPPLTIDNTSTTLLALHFNDANQACLLWWDEVENTLSLSHFMQEARWSPPSTLFLPGPIKDVQSCFDAQGNLSVIWTTWNGLENIIQGVFYSQTMKCWTHISDLSPISCNCCSPTTAINAKGEGIAAWQASLTRATTQQSFIQAVTFNTRTRLWSKPFNFGYDWINTSLSHPAVAIDTASNLVIFWDKLRPNVQETCLQYIRFLASNQNWSYISELESGSMHPQCGKNGEIFWTTCTGPSQGLNIAKFDISNNLWLDKHHLANLDQKIAAIRIGEDPLGKRNLFWLNASSLQVTHYDKQWHPSVYMDKNLKCDLYDFVNDKLGNVVLTILHKGQLLYCVGNYLLPPEDFYGKRTEVRYPTRKAYQAHLYWSHTYSPNIMRYILRRNGIVIGMLPVHSLQYTDFPCPINEVQYELTAVNVDNIESLPIKLNL
jgi:hypothetical protein